MFNALIRRGPLNRQKAYFGLENEPFIDDFQTLHLDSRRKKENRREILFSAPLLLSFGRIE